MRTLVRAGRLLRFQIERTSHAVLVQYPLQKFTESAREMDLLTPYEGGQHPYKGGQQ